MRPDHSTAGSALSMKSGIIGKPDQHTEERALRSDGITTQDGSGGASRYVAAYLSMYGFSQV